MKSQWDFGTVIGLIAGIICIYVTMIWPEKEASEIIITKGDDRDLLEKQLLEKALEKRLIGKIKPESEGNAIKLSLDLPVQAEVENVLKKWQKRMGAKAGGV